MCCCLVSHVCGLPLRRVVTIIGFCQLVFAAIVSIVDLADSNCWGNNINCWGPITRQILADSVFSVACALLLIFGARRPFPGHQCGPFFLLWIWLVIAFCLSINYSIVIIMDNFWNRKEVFIAILYLFFYIGVAIIVRSYMKLDNEAQGRVHQPTPHQAIFTPPTTVSTIVTPYPSQPASQPLQVQAVAYPPQAASNPYPPQLSAYPPQPSAYPLQPSAYPPQPSAYPPQAASYLPQGYRYSSQAQAYPPQ